MCLKNIAVLVSGIDEEYQNKIISGIKDYAMTKHLNVSFFISFGGILHSRKHDIGEYNIFNLVNFSKFDGAILLTNTISDAKVVEQILYNVRKANIPTVNIDLDMEDMFYIGIDNEASMKKIVEHLIQHHKLTKINYVSGPDDNIDSIERLSAYKKVLEEHNIPIEEERIFHGFFRGQDGRDAVKSFYNSELGLPEAVVFANDAMALSAIIELENYGVTVPDDIIVTGFDNIYMARNFYPTLTSVQRPLYETGVKACELIYNHLHNIPQERVHILDTTAVFSESCGCNISTNDNINAFKKTNYKNMESYHIDIAMINKMSECFTESINFKDNMESLKKFVKEFDCDGLYLCLCKDLEWEYKENNFNLSLDYLVEGYTSTVSVPLAYENGKFVEYDNININEMHPNLFQKSEESNIYFFSPIHYQDRCLGYCVLRNSTFPTESPIFHTWIMNISNSLENIRKLHCLNSAIKELEKLYILDPLGNIYNRNGFTKFSRELYRQSIIESKQIMIMFLDMDGLKYINDHYGHKEGDVALKQLARTITDSCVNDEICARFGGDEFIIFGSDYTEESAIALRDVINNGLKQYNSISGKPYSLEVSIGHYITQPKPDISIFKIVNIADKKMYENKLKKHHSKYIRRNIE